MTARDVVRVAAACALRCAAAALAEAVAPSYPADGSSLGRKGNPFAGYDERTGPASPL
ncbi:MULTISPECIES: hypothetical protein [unclassified Nocardioides]|uniref:hypothetical protein n=1 Tax=unclassified Nocardioides TaxID=2615069 RepID=UPI001358CF06|nr:MULTISPECIES: hypothetical protein [unclassified Nocardioides]WGY02051.1 hypothetical protein QI633_26400 [Nocardioides sp. QY071]